MYINYVNSYNISIPINKFYKLTLTLKTLIFYPFHVIMLLVAAQCGIIVMDV